MSNDKNNRVLELKRRRLHKLKEEQALEILHLFLYF